MDCRDKFQRAGGLIHKFQSLVAITFDLRRTTC
jgi:hypothetical protein